MTLVAEVRESYIHALPRITRSSSPAKMNKVHQLLIDMIRCFVFPVFLAALFTEASALAQQKTVTIAVVNNADMIRPCARRALTVRAVGSGENASET